MATKKQAAARAKFVKMAKGKAKGAAKKSMPASLKKTLGRA